MASRAKRIGPELVIKSCTLNSIFQKSVKERPNSLAIVACHQKHDLFASLDPSLGSRNEQYLCLTYEQLDRLAGSYAKCLQDAGITQGDSIATVLRNSIEWVLTLWACAKLGAALVSLDPRITSREEVFKHCIAAASVKAIIVTGTEDADIVDKHIPNGQLSLKITAESEIGNSSWTSLSSFLQHLQPFQQLESNAKSIERSPCLVVFTSGTTGLPKACPITAENVIGGTSSAIHIRKLDQRRKLLSLMPMFHVSGLTQALAFWRLGATVVIPSYAFNADLSIQAMRAERCTDVTLVPTVLQALQHNSNMSENMTESVVSVAISGTTVSPANVTTMHELFPRAKVQISFGMTEAVMVIGWSSSISPPIEDKGLMSIGYPLPGCRAKICGVESTETLEIGAVGELHIRGHQLISKYIDREADDFYTDSDGLSWIRTGDQAKMDKSNAFFILGRYKDTIIRGGENISPVHIENALNGIEGVKCHVVGCADDIAGEVPIAVLDDKAVEDPLPASRDGDLMTAVVKTCGEDHALGGVVRLSELNMTGFPTTPSGKVEKAVLRQSVAEMMSSRKNPPTSSRKGSISPESILDDIRDIWHKLLGPQFLEISATASLHGQADSITVMRARRQINLRFGVLLEVNDLLAEGGIEHQAKIVKELGSTSSGKEFKKETPWTQRATTEKMAFAHGCENTINRLASLASPTLESLGLSWDKDVDDAAPANHEHMLDHAQAERPHTWNLRRTMIAEVDAEALRAAMQTVLSLPHWSIKRCISVKNDEGSTMLLFLKPSTELWESIMEELPPVKDIEALKELHETLDMHSQWPGPWFKMKLIPIQDQNATALMIQEFHGFTDAVSHGNFMEDFNAVLTPGKKDLPARIPYQFLGNMRQNHQKSFIAKQNAIWNANRLKGISGSTKNFWPSQRCPGRFLGNDKGWSSKNSQTDSVGQRQPVDTTRGETMVHVAREFPRIPTMRSEADLSPMQILRAALVLFSAHMSKSDAGVFGQIEAGRQWPFMEGWMQDALGDPFDISGCLIRFVPVLTRVNRSTKVIDFLRTIAADQRELMEHSLYIDKDVEERLDGADVEACSLRYRMCLNWIPYVRRMTDPDWHEYDQIRHVKTNIESDMTLVWRCGMIDNTKLGIWGSFDRCQLSPKEVEDAGALLLELVGLITDSENQQKLLKDILPNN